MTTVFKLLVRLNAVRLTTTWLQRKIVQKDIPAIEFAVRYGHYDVRGPAAIALGQLNAKRSIPVLMNAMNDPLISASRSAMEALETIGCSEETLQKINQKRAYWMAYEREKREQKPSKEKLFIPERKERPSKKSFDNLKQMLRKPMNTGKWF